MVAYEAFAATLAKHASEIAKLDTVVIDNPDLDAQQISGQAWELINSLGIVENISKLVPHTKALHHLLPDLIVPIDREYTQTFFGIHNPEFQGQNQPRGQKMVFIRMFLEIRTNRADSKSQLLCWDRRAVAD